MTRSKKRKFEFGDFQTPDELAYEVTQLLKSTEILPSVVIEPTCGLGSFIKNSIAPLKVAVSGFYKNISFAEIGKFKRKPIVVDDTCYFIPCNCEEETNFVANLLNSKIAKSFIHSLVFFDAKRPLTVDILKRIDLKKLAEKLNKEREACSYLTNAEFGKNNQKVLVFEKPPKYRKSSAK